MAIISYPLNPRFKDNKIPVRDQVIDNVELGTTDLGTKYYDYVQFALTDNYKTDIFVNSTVTVNRDFKVSTTFINGRNNSSVKQMTGKGDWLITFNINVFKKKFIENIQSEYSYEFNTLNTGIDKYTKGGYSTDGFRYDLSQPKTETTDLIKFLDNFFNNADVNGNTVDASGNTISYNNISVTSDVLNKIFNIRKIIPTSISFNQNHEIINSYNIIINAISDEGDLDVKNSSSEIIPNNETLRNA